MVGFSYDGRAKSIEEKPERSRSKYAVTGLYFVDETAPERAKKVTPSARGELELTSLRGGYIREDQFDAQKMGRGYAWLDTETHASLLDADNFVKTLPSDRGSR